MGEPNCFETVSSHFALGIMQKFAHQFYRNNPNTIFANADVAYILAFSVILLNTDAHNPAIKKQQKMSKAAFVIPNSNSTQSAFSV